MPENCCNLPKIQTKRPNLREFCQKDANGIANSEDPDQTAQTCLSKNLGSLPYSISIDKMRLFDDNLCIEERR